MSTVVFDVLARDNASKVFGKVADSADKAGKQIGGSFGKLGKSLVGAVAGFATISVFKGFIDSAEESRKVGRLTAQVIKTTGAAAKVTASQVGDLATAISNKTGIDDEAIQSGANLLLTFTGIRNEVGKGNDIFSRATGVITDMSVALGTDVKASAIQVGKALNDPIKGVTALQKVGVSFTEKQKEQIKTLVQSGKTLDAQKIILKELGTEFGGAAAAAASPSQKLSVILGNLGESIGTALLPMVDKVATFLGEKLVPGLIKVGHGAKQVFDALFHGDFHGGPFQEDSPFIDVVFKIRDAMLKLTDFIRSNVVPVLREAGAFIATNFLPTIGKIRDFIETRILPAARKLIGFLVSTFTPTFKALSTYITGTVIPAYQKLALKIKENIGPIMKVVGAIVYLAAKILGFVLPILIKLTGFMAGNMFSVLIKAVGIIGGVARAIIAIATAAVDAGRKIGAFATGIYNAVKALPGKISAATHGMWDGIKNSFRAAINWIISKWNGLEFRIPSVNTHIPGVGKVGGFTLGTPDIPKLAAGGIVTRPTLALVGESGPEAVIPLSRGRGDAGGLHIHFDGPVYGTGGAQRVAKDIATAVMAEMRSQQRRGGLGPIPA